MPSDRVQSRNHRRRRETLESIDNRVLHWFLKGVPAPLFNEMFWFGYLTAAVTAIALGAAFL